MEGKEEPKCGPYFVGKKDELIEAKRTFRTIEGRDVLIVHHDGVFHSLDSYCYHTGAELQGGDIEELGGRLCIICPRHQYKISLADGEGIYKAVNPREHPTVAKWFSRGVKQRVHTVTESDGDVYVTLRMDTGWIESDHFQGEKGKEERERAAEAEKVKEEEKAKAKEEKAKAKEEKAAK